MRVVPLLMLISALALAAGGCPKSGAPETSGEQAAPAPTKSRWDATTRSYLDALRRIGIVGFDTADEGASVVYDSLTLDDDGGFEARTSLRLGDVEPFACVETGTWTLDDDKAETATSGRFTLQVTESDCPGRALPKTLRAKLDIDGDDVRISQF